MFNFFFKNRAEKNKQRKIQRERCKSWFIAKGDKTLRLDYDLNKDLRTNFLIFEKHRIDILGGKASIKQNKFDVW